MHFPSYFAFVALALPWLNPLTYGPTHPIVQALVVWMATSLCWLTWELAQVSTLARIRTIAAAWLAAAIASAAMGLLQYIGLAEHFSPLINYVEAGQAYANLRQRNQLATLLSIGLAALLWWQARSAGRAASSSDGQSRALSALLIMLVMLLVAADAASGSRTGLLQLLLLLALGLVWRQGRATMLLAALGYAVAAMALPHLAGSETMQSGILGRVGEATAPCESRLTLWSNVLHLIAQRPWLGWGWGELDYAHFVTLYSGRRFCDILGNAHNLPLHLAVELGIPFALVFCGVLVWMMLRGRPWREQNATRQMAWSVLAVLGVHSMLEYPLWYAPFQLAALLAIWLLWQTRPSKSERAVPVSSAGRTPSLMPMTVAALVIVACAYVGWDYWRISQIYLPEAQRVAAYRVDTLDKARDSWLFADQVKFAELGVTPLTRDNAAHIHALALDMLHFSPEQSVVEKLLNSALLMNNREEADYFEQRYQVAFPQEYALWKQVQGLSPGDKAP
jgi:O-antigen ligase